MMEITQLLEAAGRDDLCFFVGLTQPQAAKELGISLATVQRTWAFARAWLFREVHNSRSSPGETPRLA
jgi:hypothetical protein